MCAALSVLTERVSAASVSTPSTVSVKRGTKRRDIGVSVPSAPTRHRSSESPNARVAIPDRRADVHLGVWGRPRSDSDPRSVRRRVGAVSHLVREFEDLAIVTGFVGAKELESPAPFLDPTTAIHLPFQTLVGGPGLDDDVRLDVVLLIFGGVEQIGRASCRERV